MEEHFFYCKSMSVNTSLSLVFKIGLALVILATFFLFTNLTTELYDTPKFLVLLTFTGILLLILALKFTASGKVVFVRTPLDIPLLLLLVVGIVSTILSPSPYVAALGNQLKIHGSLVSLIVYILLYFILVNSLKNIKEIKWIFTFIVIAAQILAVVTLLAYAGIKLLPNPTGSSFSTTAILALLIPLVTAQILGNTKPLIKIINAVFLILMGVTIALTGTWATWIAGIIAFVLTFAAISPIRQINRISPINLICLIGPIVIIALVAILSFVPPVGKANNPLYTKAQNFPREIQLPFVTAWKISVSAFRDSPIWGTGPSTYQFDFTNYKPIEFNSSKFWNLRFDSSFNEYLQVLATLGGIGLLALLSLTAVFISAAYKTISEAIHLRGEETQLHLGGEKTILAISGLVFFIILALHPSSLVLWTVGILVLSSFMVANLGTLQKNWSDAGDFKKRFLRIAGFSSASSSTETIKVDALPGILLMVSLVLVLAVAFFGGKLVLADYHHKLAINAVAKNQGIVAYNELVITEKLNPRNDLYRTDLAQTNFALANAIATAKGPTEASPAGSLTDQDKQNIQVLLQQSINEGRTAVTLSPKSAVNWEILGLLYRQISGVATNGLAFSLDSYGRAIAQDPLNPQLRVNVGGIYYATKNYDMAIRLFTDAINLKPDFANAHYNLAVALKDKGDLKGAQAEAEQALKLVDSKSADYKIVNDFLAGLKNEPATQPPAAKTTGVLQEKGLPKVLDLPKPANIATPEAIKKSAASPTPSPTKQP